MFVYVDYMFLDDALNARNATNTYQFFISISLQSLICFKTFIIGGGGGGGGGGISRYHAILVMLFQKRFHRERQIGGYTNSPLLEQASEASSFIEKTSQM